MRMRQQVPVGSKNGSRHPGDGIQDNGGGGGGDKFQVERIAEEVESDDKRPGRLPADRRRRIATQRTPETVANGLPEGDHQAPGRIRFQGGWRRRRGQ